TGDTRWHGPHHSAQTATRMAPGLRTSASNVKSVSVTGPDHSAADGPGVDADVRSCCSFRARISTSSGSSTVSIRHDAGYESFVTAKRTGWTRMLALYFMSSLQAK